MDANLSWNDIKWVQDLAPGLPVLVKGVQAPEDVELAKRHGAAGVILSNHGGESSRRSSLSCIETCLLMLFFARTLRSSIRRSQSSHRHSRSHPRSIPSTPL